MNQHEETTVANERGVKDIDEAARWFSERGIQEIECTVPDLSGMPRGKVMPVEKFLKSSVMKLPLSVFHQGISGDYPDYSNFLDEVTADSDLSFAPDFSTLCVVPWASEPTAQIIHNAFSRNGEPVGVAPRQVLQTVTDFFLGKGLYPIVAPEIEFYMVEKNIDPDYPLSPPIGRSGRAEIGEQSYSIFALAEFDDLFEDIYKYAEAQGVEIDTLIHEDGPGQFEINLCHAGPLQLADEVYFAKRAIREGALKHNMYATFMAMPMEDKAGSAMHIHVSLVNEAGVNAFSGKDGSETRMFHNFVAGLQTYVPHMMSIFAPYVNSYRRILRGAAAPINVQWGYDNRTTGLRIPDSDPKNRRIENRIPGSDCNPYLAIAATLAAGYLGIVQDLEPVTPPSNANFRYGKFEVARGLLEAVNQLKACEPIHKIMGSDFIDTFSAVKHAEFETFMKVISPWEREHLLLHV